MKNIPEPELQIVPISEPKQPAPPPFPVPESTIDYYRELERKIDRILERLRQKSSIRR